VSEMILHDDRDTIIAGLREQLRQAREELLAKSAKDGQVERGIAALRQSLGPLYGALQNIFEETDAMQIPHSSTAQNFPQKSAVWDDWKKKLGGAAAKIIDVLHLHGELTQKQLAIHIGTSRIQTVYDAVFKLNKAGIINKNGGKISLKEL
jgi:hypothetical protein